MNESLNGIKLFDKSDYSGKEWPQVYDKETKGYTNLFWTWNLLEFIKKLTDIDFIEKFDEQKWAFYPNTKSIKVFTDLRIVVTDKYGYTLWGRQLT